MDSKEFCIRVHENIKQRRNFQLQGVAPLPSNIDQSCRKNSVEDLLRKSSIILMENYALARRRYFADEK